MKVKVKVWLEEDDKLVLGKGRYLILRAIAETGSINKAAKKLDMSYRHIWSYIISAEKRYKIPLLVKAKGGKGGGGAVLTEQAKVLLEKFNKLEEEVKKFTEKRYREIFAND